MKKKSKKFSILLLVVCILAAAVYAGSRWYISSLKDTASPKISFDSDNLSVSVSVTQEELLKGVSAYDDKDGDVTDSLMIESLSALLDGNRRIVTYAAFDGDSNVGKAQRQIVYTDYTSPRLSLTEPLVSVSATAGSAELVKGLGATDCIDGDITDEMVLLSSNEEITVGSALMRVVKIQVTNSCGDIAEADIPVMINTSWISAASDCYVALSDYLVYIEKGESFDPLSLVTEVRIDGVDAEASLLSVATNLNTETAGTYAVIYTAGEGDGAMQVPLVVIVSESLQ